MKYNGQRFIRREIGSIHDKASIGMKKIN